MTDDYYSHARPEALALLKGEPRKVLDIGCGKGGVSRELQRRYPGVSCAGADYFYDKAFDYSEVFERFEQCDLERDSIRYDVAEFDLILLLDVLEHLREPEQVLGRLVGQASPGTSFLVSLPNFHYYSNLWQIARTARFRYEGAGILDATHLRFFGYADALELVGMHLDVVAFKPFNPFPNMASKLVNATLGPRYSAYQNIFLCRKGSGEA